MKELLICRSFDNETEMLRHYGSSCLFDLEPLMHLSVEGAIRCVFEHPNVLAFTSHVSRITLTQMVFFTRSLSS